FNKIDLKKICINILSNAIKYTKKGYVKVYMQDDSILFQNNGEEIKAEFKNKIFEPFFTISKSKNRKYSGCGLGLSIVNNLSKNNDYKTVLKSSDSEKTIFSLELDSSKHDKKEKR
ncbi:ATP-binding protein, partial [Poseidonibacter sp.]|uniref:ATP-binding protein n=1 Tax=Poseidonibacter sp. TaxID=2321188 RepID=UPI003C7239E3